MGLKLIFKDKSGIKTVYHNKKIFDIYYPKTKFKKFYSTEYILENNTYYFMTEDYEPATLNSLVVYKIG